MKIHEYNEMMAYLTRPATRQTVASGGRIGFSTAGLVKILLSKIKPYTGATKIGESTKKLDRGPEKKFIEAFLEYARKNFDGNKSAALRKLGINREKYRGIESRTLGGEERKVGNISQRSKVLSVIPTPKDVILYKDATTKAKSNKDFFKKFVTDKNKNEFYTAKDIGNILKINVSDKKQIDRLVEDLNRFDVNFKETGFKTKKFKLGDAVNKITKGYEKKLVKGDKQAKTKRLEIESRLDPELTTFYNNFKAQVREISKEEDLFVPNAVEDLGHALSINITDKYPQLIKNSNINKINTLTFQDPILNKEILLKSGYENNFDNLFARLNKLVDKKVGNAELKELQLIKNEMNNLYLKAVNDTKTLAKQNKYFIGQEKRIPKIDINIPKQGQTFKSKNLFADMSNVNPAFKVGMVEDINSNAKFFNDLTKTQKEVYKKNVLDQTKFNLDKFYSKVGAPKEQINQLKDSLEIGTFGKFGIGVTGTLVATQAAAADGTQAAGFTTGEKLAGAGVAGGTYAARKPIMKGLKTAGKVAAKTLAPLAVPLEAGFVLSDLKSGASTPEALANVAMLGGAVRQKEKMNYIINKYGEDVYRELQLQKGNRDAFDIGLDETGEISDYYKQIDLEGDQAVQDLRTTRAEDFERKSNLPKPEIGDYLDDLLGEGND